MLAKKRSTHNTIFLVLLLREQAGRQDGRMAGCRGAAPCTSAFLSARVASYLITFLYGGTSVPFIGVTASAAKGFVLRDLERNARVTPGQRFLSSRDDGAA